MVRWTVFAALLMASAHASAKGPDVKAGVDAWSRGDYGQAIATWRPLAIAGDADAQFNMGQAYKLGRGVPVDLLVAEDWYRRAALQGHLQAEDNYGLVMFQNGNRQRALPFIEKSAARGEPRAQYLLGTALFNGDMVKRDWVRAYALMTRASAAGLAPASASLAQMDKFIPLDQRQQGMVLAREIEARADRPATAVAQAAPPVIKPRAAVRQKAPPPAGTPVAPATAPAAAAPKPVALAPASGGKWRVQLGAFGDAAKAGQLWSSLKGRISVLQPLTSFQVKAGAVTRLQAGPLESRNAAERVCSAVKAAGAACLPVAA